MVVFTTTFLTFPQSQQRKARISKGSIKKSFAIRLLQYYDLKTQQRYILQEETNISQRKHGSLASSSPNFLRTFDKSEQVFTDSVTETQKLDRIHKVERQSICSLLERYH